MIGQIKIRMETKTQSRAKYYFKASFPVIAKTGSQLAASTCIIIKRRIFSMSRIFGEIEIFTAQNLLILALLCTVADTINKPFKYMWGLRNIKR